MRQFVFVSKGERVELNVTEDALQRYPESLLSTMPPSLSVTLEMDKIDTLKAVFTPALVELLRGLFNASPANFVLPVGLELVDAHSFVDYLGMDVFLQLEVPEASDWAVRARANLYRASLRNIDKAMAYIEYVLFTSHPGRTKYTFYFLNPGENDDYISKTVAEQFVPMGVHNFYGQEFGQRRDVAPLTREVATERFGTSADHSSWIESPFARHLFEQRLLPRGLEVSLSTKYAEISGARGECELFVFVCFVLFCLLFVVGCCFGISDSFSKTVVGGNDVEPVHRSIHVLRLAVKELERNPKRARVGGYGGSFDMGSE